VAAPILQMELPTASTMASNPDPSVGEECQKADLDTTVGENTRNLDLMVARILPEAMAATWEVPRLREILPMTSRIHHSRTGDT
jgi:hypothetical protein